MKLGIILNTKEPETVWNALRLGNEALKVGSKVSIFLLGSGVEITNINEQTFNVPKVLGKFLEGGGNLLACGTCLKLRNQEASVCPISTMAELVQLISDSDKVLTFG